jgi:threonine/homoserine/homoserine lactone efflux protein
MLAISNSIRHDIKASAIGALGCVTGTGLMGLLSALGLGALIMTSGVLFTIIHYVGAAYLIWLGIRYWRESRLPAVEDVSAEIVLRRPGILRLYVQGFIISVSNPKAIAFFTALFPIFIDHDAPLLTQFAIMDTTFVIMSFSAMMGYAFFAARSRQFLTGNGKKWFQRVSGSIFVSFGIGLAVSAR